MNYLLLVCKLVLSQMWRHPGRAIITMVGVIASTCAVVWVVSGYDALVSQFDENAGKFLGRYDALVLTAAPPGTFLSIDEGLTSQLRADPGVLEFNPITQSRVSVTSVPKESDSEASKNALELLVGSRPPVNGAPPIDPVLVSTPATEPPYDVLDGKWFSEADEKLVAVMSYDAAQQVGVSVGDEILITSLANQVQLTLIGIVEQAPDAPSLGGYGPPIQKESKQSQQGAAEDEDSAAIKPESPEKEASSRPTNLGMPNAYTEGPATHAVYVRPSVGEKINGFPAYANVLQISLRDGVTTTEFQKVWKSRFAESEPPVKLVSYEEVRQGMESSYSVTSQASQAWAATGMAAMAAVFIIFSTLSMGVSERAREFAMLRAIALRKSQLAGVIAFESMILALLGWLGGLLAGWVMLRIGSQLAPGLFGAGAVLGQTSVLLTGLTVLAGAFGAAILPAWRAMRIEPLEAMSSQTRKQRFRWWGLLGMAGLLLTALAPLSVFVIPMPDGWRIWFYAIVSWPALVVGMMLLSPMIVIGCERLLAPGLSWSLRLDGRLVKSQLSSNMWRTIGATLALSLGLALFTSTQTWGVSMLQQFMPGEWLPDMLVAFHPIGLDEDGFAEVQQVNGVKAEEVMPLAIEQAKFDWGDAAAPSGLRYDNAVLFGVEPGWAFDEDAPFLQVPFVEGDRDAAIKALESGDACIISEDFQMKSGLGIGDELGFTPSNAEEERVAYRIVAVVSLPGWQWITKFSGVRRHFVRTSTMIFAGREHVRRDFHLERTEFFWMNLDPEVPLTSIEKDLQQIAERDAGGSFQSEGYGEITAYRPFARATATQTVRKAIALTAGATIWGMSQLPLITLVIMSLAVANAIMASVRSRTWEYGVLRSIGFRRWQLVRLILLETILIAVVACFLSLAFGLIAGWCGVGMAKYGRWAAGPPVFLIPWAELSIGFALTLVLCLLAGLWPAFRVGRAEPLTLLQAGRGGL
ncbi:Acidobacterial duplicated orphan permease [Planctomycetales bacterium 10988]|nr:Acidobacterial duplicated orphan permease [Planctomycetales bacterium 10988]